jgi:hypothetical protein
MAQKLDKNNFLSIPHSGRHLETARDYIEGEILVRLVLIDIASQGHRFSVHCLAEEEAGFNHFRLYCTNGKLMKSLTDC